MIVERGLRPGGAIPTRRDLADELRVSLTSVQRGVARLVEQGFVAVDGTRRTVVAETPPHLYRYAVVFPQETRLLLESPFLLAMYRAAADLPELAPRVFERHALPDYYPGVGAAPFARLAAEARARRLAGLLFAGDASQATRYGLALDGAAAPLAAVWYERTKYPNPAAVLVDVDWGSFVARAVDLVAAAGLKRMAILWNGSLRGAEGITERETERAGLRCPRGWQQFPGAYHPQPARHAVRLLFEAPASRRPQALVVADDGLTGAVCRELVDMGLGSGRDPLIISHTNYPRPQGVHLPVTWLGFDTHEWFRTAVAALEARKPGDALRSCRIPARTPEEVAAAGEAAHANGARGAA